MREIKFRGINKHTGKWVFGYFRKFDCGVYWINDYIVKENTVGQYTGLKDKNGVEIYEGDIVTGIWAFGKFSPSPVEFYKGSFGVRWKHFDDDDFYAFSTFCDTDWKVIGNIHDNPELLEEL